MINELINLQVFDYFSSLKEMYLILEIVEFHEYIKNFSENLYS